MGCLALPRMTLKEHLNKNIQLAYPVMIGQLGHIMVAVADSVMVGRVGVIPLAAATFAGTFYHILLLFGIGTSYAITPLVAASPNDKPKVLQFLQDGLLVNLVVGVLLVLMGLLASQFLQAFGQEPAVAAEAKAYLQITCLSILPLMVFQTFRQFAEGLSDTFNPMLVSVVTNLLNVGLNYVLIFGHFGFPALGLLGAGIATLLARVMMAFLMIARVRSKTSGFKWVFTRSGIRRDLQLGVPAGLQYIFEVGAFATAAIMVGWLGAEYLAAHNIALNLAAITYMAATGIGAAAAIRVGNQYGLRDVINLRRAGFSCMALVMVFMGICGLLFILLRRQLPGLYVESLPVQETAASLLVIAAAFQVSDGLQAVGLGALRGLTDVRVPTWVTFIAFWLIAIPLAYVLGFTFSLGVHGIWYALLTGLSLAAILHIWRFQVITRRLLF